MLARQPGTQTDEAAEAQALIDDLLALLGAGLVATRDAGGTLRYAAVDEALPADRHRSP